MRIRISLEGQALKLPIHYEAWIQGLIYNQIEPNLATWLHGEAYQAAKRTYKMFTYSCLAGNFSRVNEHLHFRGPLSFQLASLNTDLLCSLAMHLLKAPSVQLGPHECAVRGVEVLAQPQVDFDRPVRVKALGPITVYSTLQHADGRKKTYYYSPQEGEWSRLLVANLAHKAQALGWQGDPAEALKDAWVRPYRVSAKDQKIVLYRKLGQRDFVIKGWTGLYELNLPEPYFWLAYDTGLGAKNAQGFGMVEVC